MPISVPVVINNTMQTIDSLPYLGKWQVVEDEIRMTDTSLIVSGDTGGLSIPVRSTGDIELALEFYMDRGEGNGAGGPVIGFRTQPDGSRYEFRYISDFNTCVLFKKTQSQPWNEIGHAADVPVSAESWHTLKMTAHADVFSVAIDGKEVATARDVSLRSGGVSLGCTVRPVRFRKLCLEGRITAAKAVMPPNDEQVRIICADAFRGGYQGFPRLCRLKNGDILCVFYAGGGHTTAAGGSFPKGGAAALCRSADGGRSWSAPTVVLDSGYDDSGANIWQQDDGTVRILSYGLDHKAWQDMKGYHHYYTVTSTDNGHTWGKAVEAEFGGEAVGELNPWTNPLKLANGEMLFPIYWAGGGKLDQYESWRFRAGFSRSTDGGRTWGRPAYIEEHVSLMDEGDICQFPDGLLMSILRDEKQHMWQTWSRDNGHTWTRPSQLPWYGHSPNLLHTRSGVTLLCHRVPGTTVRYSLDNGKTWPGGVMIDPAGGAYSSMLELHDGRVLIAYYTEGSRSQIRCQLLEVGKEGARSLRR